MNKEIYNKLKAIVSEEDKLTFLKSKQIEITPEVISLITSNLYSLSGGFDLSSDVYRLINSFALQFGAKSVVDPFCGTGYLLYYMDDSIQKIGFERNSETSKLAQLLNPKANIETRDIIRYPPKDTYQMVATTLIPFSSVFRQLEQTIDTLLGLLKKDAFLMFVSPDSLLSSLANQKIREGIIHSHSLEAVVELGKANSQIPLELSLIVIRKASQTQSVYLGKLLPGSSGEVLKDFRKHTGEYWVDASQLGIRWDRDFHDPEYLSLENELNQKEAKLLGELAEIVAGVQISSVDRKSQGEYLVLTPANIQNGELVMTERDYYTKGVGSPQFQRAMLKEGDILVSVLGPKFKTHVYRKEDPLAVANQNFAIVRGAQFTKYIEVFLRSKTGYEQFLKQIRRRIRGSVIPRISMADLKSVLVPLLPLDDLDKAIEPKHKALSEDAITTVLIKKLEEKGWQVKREYSIKGGRHMLKIDLALFYQDTLEGIVEIKDYSSVDSDISNLQTQLDRYLQATAAPRAFAFFDGRFYEYRSGELILLRDFPSPLGNKALEPIISYLMKPRELLPDKMPESYILKYLLEMKSDIELIKETTSKTEEKVTAILNVVKDLQKAFGSVKEMPIDIEEKLILFNQELDIKIGTLHADHQDQLDMYVEIVRRWLSFDWDRLDEISKRFLPSAEYLFAQLSRFPDTDLSPFIIQYCRALENEMLNKIFRAYLQSLIDREIDILKDFGWDFGKKESGRPNDENTLRLANYVKGCLSKDRSGWFFELGTMETYLRYLTGKTVDESPLLQDLRAFIFNYFEKNVIEIDFLNELKRITRYYRNRAAHTDIITVEEAKNGRREIRDIIIQFLGYYK